MSAKPFEENNLSQRTDFSSPRRIHSVEDIHRKFRKLAKEEDNRCLFSEKTASKMVFRRNFGVNEIKNFF